MSLQLRGIFFLSNTPFKIFLIASLLLKINCSFSQNNYPVNDSTSKNLTNKQAAKNYFYYAYPFGSQALYGPLYIYLNRGYDLFQISQGDRNIFHYDFQISGNNIIENLIHPFKNIESYGWNQFITKELLPLNYSGADARWTANYALHLFGGGMTYTCLKEWLIYNKVPCPGVFSASWLMMCAFVNESVENENRVGRNTDAIADLYFFDIPGILLFNSEAVKRFFSEKLQFSDWSSQVSITFPNGYLNNVSNNFSVKLKIPKLERVYLFGYLGLTTIFGFSIKTSSENSFSFGAGMRTSEITNTSNISINNAIKMGASTGFFYDRKNSLLFSLIITSVSNNFCNLNIYPGIIKIKNFTPGLWVIFNDKLQPSFGISTHYSLGIGLGKYW